MTLGRFIDEVRQGAAKLGITITRVDWTHSGAFDNMRISGRRGQSPARTTVLTNDDTENWTTAHVREAVKGLEAMLRRPDQ